MILADEEIMETIKLVFPETIPVGTFDLTTRLCKAQLKKVVEELARLNKYHRFGFEDGTLLIYKEDMQALLKEIGWAKNSK